MHILKAHKNPAGHTTNVHAHFRYFGQSQADLLPLQGIEPPRFVASSNEKPGEPGWL